MKALLSINNYHYVRGGAEAVYLAHNALFREHGWQVVELAMRHSDNLDSDWDAYFVEEIELGRDLGPAEAVRKAAKSVYSREAYQAVQRLIDDSKAEIAHAHNIYHHLSPAVLLGAKAAGLPVVLTVHDLKLACPAYKMLTHDGVCERCRGGRLYNVLRHRCIHGSTALSGLVFVEAVVHRLLRSYQRSVDLFAVPSQFYIDKLVEWGWDRERFRLLPNFVDPAAFAPAFRPGDYFVYFGRLSDEKGVDTLLRAASQAGVKLVIAGTGPREARLRALAEELGLDAEFRGYLTGQPLADLVAGARAVVLPSEWYENGPMAVLEAYARGKPVIAARIGGLPEAVHAGETGAVFESGRVDELAEALIRFANAADDELERMGRAARALVERDYTRERYFERCSAIYAELPGHG